MAKSIKLTAKQWTSIRKRLQQEFSWKPSIFMIRETMKRELGFTTRYHSEWNEQTGYSESIYLDFFDDQLETMFRLKYL